MSDSELIRCTRRGIEVLIGPRAAGVAENMRILQEHVASGGDGVLKDLLSATTGKFFEKGQNFQQSSQIVDDASSEEKNKAIRLLIEQLKARRDATQVETEAMSELVGKLEILLRTVN